MYLDKAPDCECAKCSCGGKSGKVSSKMKVGRCEDYPDRRGEGGERGWEQKGQQWVGGDTGGGGREKGMDKVIARGADYQEGGTAVAAVAATTGGVVGGCISEKKVEEVNC